VIADSANPKTPPQKWTRPLSRPFRDRKCGSKVVNWSGRRDSNPRPQPWQGCALPLSYTRSSNRVRPPSACAAAPSYGATRKRLQEPSPRRVIALQTGRITAPRPLVQRPSPLGFGSQFRPLRRSAAAWLGCGQGLGCLDLMSRLPPPDPAPAPPHSLDPAC
jgi:hypothetical protein